MRVVNTSEKLIVIAFIIIFFSGFTSQVYSAPCYEKGGLQRLSPKPEFFTTSTLNVRAGPTLDCEVITRLDKSEKIIAGRTLKGEWYEFIFKENGRTRYGWVSAKYLTTDATTKKTTQTVSQANIGQNECKKPVPKKRDYSSLFKIERSIELSLSPSQRCRQKATIYPGEYLLYVGDAIENDGVYIVYKSRAYDLLYIKENQNISRGTFTRLVTVPRWFADRNADRLIGSLMHIPPSETRTVVRKAAIYPTYIRSSPVHSKAFGYFRKGSEINSYAYDGGRMLSLIEFDNTKELRLGWVEVSDLKKPLSAEEAKLKLKLNAAPRQFELFVKKWWKVLVAGYLVFFFIGLFYTDYKRRFQRLLILIFHKLKIPAWFWAISFGCFCAALLILPKAPLLPLEGYIQNYMAVLYNLTEQPIWLLVILFFALPMILFLLAATVVFPFTLVALPAFIAMILYYSYLSVTNGGGIKLPPKAQDIMEGKYSLVEIVWMLNRGVEGNVVADEYSRLLKKFNQDKRYW